MNSTITFRAAVAGYHGADALEPEFTEIGFDYFDEQFVDFLYEVYIAMMVDRGWCPRPQIGGHAETHGIEDIGRFYVDGIYIPLARRVVLTDQVDLRNFTPPESATLLKSDRREAQINYTFMRVDRVSKLPIGWVAPTRGVATYKLTLMYRSRPTDQDLTLSSMFIVVKKNGQVIPCHSKRHTLDGDVIRALGYWSFAATVTINANDDARHLWEVQTGEHVVGGQIRTPLMLGCDPDRIKSLFYARSLPMTASGRKRPILHWVEAHGRRLKSGIDIDISKHLRGIERFELGGFNFEITSPVKKSTSVA